MVQFHKENIDPEWQDLVEEFPCLILEPSPSVLELFRDYGDEKFPSFPNRKEDLCNLRFGFECGVGWKGIIRDFFSEVSELMAEAETNGHDFMYRPFILKSKFKTCRDQGDIFGRDATLYRDRYYEISERLFDKSTKIEQYPEGAPWTKK